MIVPWFISLFVRHIGSYEVFFLIIYIITVSIFAYSSQNAFLFSWAKIPKIELLSENIYMF